MVEFRPLFGDFLNFVKNKSSILFKFCILLCISDALRFVKDQLSGKVRNFEKKHLINSRLNR